MSGTPIQPWLDFIKFGKKDNFFSLIKILYPFLVLLVINLNDALCEKFVKLCKDIDGFLIVRLVVIFNTVLEIR